MAGAASREPSAPDTAGSRVVPADDDVLLREGIASLLDRSGFEVVGQCDNARALLRLAREQEPELVIVDIRMPPGHSTEGLDAAREIREHLPTIAILVLSAVGGADLGRGSGIVGLEDRVEALSGRLTLRSEPGAGTSITVELPLAGDSR